MVKKASFFIVVQPLLQNHKFFCRSTITYSGNKFIPIHNGVRLGAKIELVIYIGIIIWGTIGRLMFNYQSFWHVQIIVDVVTFIEAILVTFGTWLCWHIFSLTRIVALLNLQEFDLILDKNDVVSYQKERESIVFESRYFFFASFIVIILDFYTWMRIYGFQYCCYNIIKNIVFILSAIHFIDVMQVPAWLERRLNIILDELKSIKEILAQSHQKNLNNPWNEYGMKLRQKDLEIAKKIRLLEEAHLLLVKVSNDFSYGYGRGTLMPHITLPTSAVQIVIYATVSFRTKLYYETNVIFMIANFVLTFSIWFIEFCRFTATCIRVKFIEKEIRNINQRIKQEISIYEMDVKYGKIFSELTYFTKQIDYMPIWITTAQYYKITLGTPYRVFILTMTLMVVFYQLHFEFLKRYGEY